MVVLQTMTGKMTGVKWWTFIFAPRFCDVSVLPCLVEIVTLNTKTSIYMFVVLYRCSFSTLGTCCMWLSLVDSLCISVDVK